MLRSVPVALPSLVPSQSSDRRSPPANSAVIANAIAMGTTRSLPFSIPRARANVATIGERSARSGCVRMLTSGITAPRVANSANELSTVSPRTTMNCRRRCALMCRNKRVRTVHRPSVPVGWPREEKVASLDVLLTTSRRSTSPAMPQGTCYGLHQVKNGGMSHYNEILHEGDLVPMPVLNPPEVAQPLQETAGRNVPAPLDVLAQRGIDDASYEVRRHAKP